MTPTSPKKQGAIALCPQCRKTPVSRELTAESKSVWPFCSARCKDLDLGRWLREEYRIPEKATSGRALAEEVDPEKLDDLLPGDPEFYDEEE